MEIKKPRLAAIDIGTNSFHLIIAEVNGASGKFTTLGREKVNVRLGSGSSDMKYLKPDAFQRGMETLKKFKALADSAGASVRAVATSAVREANNQDEFIQKVWQETGIKIEVASGVEEARYIYLGILQALPVFDKKILLIDIGGGSTEFLIGHRKEIAFDSSLKLGAIRLTQRFFPGGETNSKSVKTCRQFIKGYMQPVMRDIEKFRWEICIGSSGTILNLASIINIRRGNSPEQRLNNFTFKDEELYETVSEIVESKTPKSRLKIPGLDPQRADIIPAGALILEQIFLQLKINQMMISEFALREGIIYDTIEKLFIKDDIGHLANIRYKSVMHTAENFRFEKEHSLQVCRLALSIFDQTQQLHKMSNTEREYLEAAAILHEVGTFVSHSQHHRHSYYLIRNSEMLGFNENEKEIIANVARYHRKSHPKSKHIEFSKMSSEDQKTIRKLSSILRIADGLDRSHSSSVDDVNVKVKNTEAEFIIIPVSGKNTELEIWGAESKKALFEEVFNVRCVFRISENNFVNR
ncbi:MAG: Ppx/GppA family phosphatase [Ignavibacteria bacterium]|nr:Ppx/GppA family phosphatase [Ignavibacteria bacterium]